MGLVRHAPSSTNTPLSPPGCCSWPPTRTEGTRPEWSPRTCATWQAPPCGACSTWSTSPTSTVRSSRSNGLKPFTASEARQFLHAASSDRLHALYELALRTGLRKGELIGLHWEHLDLKSGIAGIHRSLQRTRTAALSNPPISPAASADSSTAQDFAASGFTAYGTRPPPCSWNRASTSS